MAIDLNAELIDSNDPTFQGMLSRLQGNILKGHGRDHSVNIFVEFDEVTGEVREHLIAVAGRLVTSAQQQHIETRHFKEFGVPGGLFGNFFLTAKGYRALGFTDAQLGGAFVEEPPPFLLHPDLALGFKEGMQAQGEALHDPAPATWEEGFGEGRIDAMILLADDDEAYLLREARALITELETFSTVLTVERGTALRTDEGEGIEHFGYVDGRSQPIFFSTDLPGEGSNDKWNPAEPLKLVLVEDKTVTAEDAFGSYFVFRKLEQDVRRFTVREHALADQLELVGSDRERAGAMAVGRFRDGTPLTLSQTDGFLPTKENNFKYDTDPEGAKCPFHAHIRKTNPRGDIERELGGTEETAERPHRIVRRGIPYGKRNRHPNAFQALEDLPTDGVGLLFACFQASIPNQFAFMQSAWANNDEFVNDGTKEHPITGEDPIIGQRPRPGAAGVPPAVAQAWSTVWDQPETQELTFGNFVTLKGGEYFFAPSLPFLQKLAPDAVK